MYIYLVLVVLLLGALASTATGGRHGRRLLAMMALLSLAVTTSTLGPLTSARRMARTSVGTASPSAALVLY